MHTYEHLLVYNHCLGMHECHVFGRRDVKQSYIVLVNTVELDHILAGKARERAGEERQGWDRYPP